MVRGIRKTVLTLEFRPVKAREEHHSGPAVQYGRNVAFRPKLRFAELRKLRKAEDMGD